MELEAAATLILFLKLEKRFNAQSIVYSFLQLAKFQRTHATDGV